MAADFLDEKRREMTSRMAELAPLVDEYQIGRASCRERV